MSDPGDKGTKRGDSAEQKPREAPKADPRGLSVNTVRLLVAGVIAAVVVVVLLVSVLGGSAGAGICGDPAGDVPAAAEGAPPLTAGEPIGLDEGELTSEAGSFGNPVYWVGPSDDASEYELTLTEEGLVYIRYLTGDAEVGNTDPDFITVGTYPLQDANAALEEAAAAGEQELSDEDGCRTLTGGDANNAYIVFEDQPNLQVEVYSPNPGEASDLIESGDVVPVD